MVRLNSPKRKILSPEDFEKYPVWTWDDQMENVQPVSEKNPSIYDYADLFIRANFKTNNYKFSGYLMGSDTFYGFVIFFKEKKFMFNVNIRNISIKYLHEIFACLKCKRFDFFPLEYESDVVLKETGKVQGILDFEM